VAERIPDALRQEIAEWLIAPNTFRLADDAADHFEIERSTVYKIRKEYEIGTIRVGRRSRSVRKPTTVDGARERFGHWLANNLRETDLTLCWTGVLLRVSEDDQARVLRLARDAALEPLAAVTDLNTADIVCFVPKMDARPSDVVDRLYQLAAVGQAARTRGLSA